MSIWKAGVMAVVLAGCGSQGSEQKRADPPVDNVVTRYAAGLAEAPQKAQDSVNAANRAIAAQQAVVDQAQSEAP